MKRSTEKKLPSNEPAQGRNLRTVRIYLAVFGTIAVFLLGVVLHQQYTAPKVCFRSLTTNDGCVLVDVVQTDEELARGLGGHKPLGPKEGLLFVFPKRDLYNFWMKDVSFPIDIAWIDDGKIVGYIEQAMPCANKVCDIYPAQSVASHAIELPAGFLRRNRLHIGSSAVIQI